MTANLNFEAESFSAYSGQGETEEYENPRDHRAGAPARDHRAGSSAPSVRDHRAAGTSMPTVRDHRTGGTVPSVRDHRTAGSFPTVRDHRTAGSSGWTGRRQTIAVPRVTGRSWTAPSRRIWGFGAPGYVRVGPSGYVWNRAGYWQRPSAYGWRGSYGWGRYPGYRGYVPGGERYRDHFRRRWPWLRDWADRGMGMGSGSYDGGYQGSGDSGSGYSGSGYSGPDSSRSDYTGSDASGVGFVPSPSATSPAMGSPATTEDPQIVSWAQGCLAQIVGGWVPQNGTLGHLTRRAIHIFQTQNQLPSTGTLDDTTLSTLGHACQAATAAPPVAPSAPDTTQAPLPNVVEPPPGMGAPPPADPTSTAPPPTPPSNPPADPSGTTPAPTPELPYWSQEYEEFENHPAVRTCEPDRCTGPYLRWLQGSLNQVFGQRLAITGTMDDATMAAVNRFRLAKKLPIQESYHVGPAIENALLAAGATSPPAVPPTQCSVSDPSKLIPILDRARGDIPLEFLLGWIDVESAWVLEPPSVTCERGFFQLYPEDSVALNLDHDRIGTDPGYSIQSGVPFINRARKQIERAVRAFGVPRNSDLYWRLVKLWHWIPSGPEKILASMSAQGVKPADWEAVRAFVRNNFDALTKIIRRDPRDGIRSVDHMFQRVNAWRQQLHR